MNRCWFAIAVGLMGCMPGCGGALSDSGNSAPTKRPDAGHEALTAATPDSPRRRRDGAIPDPADSAPHPSVTAVRTLLEAVQNGRLEDAYDFLPQQYQTDVDELVRSTAAETPPEIWAAVHRIGVKSLRVLHDKQPQLQEVLPESVAEPLRELIRDLDEEFSRLDLEQLTSLDALRRFDSRRFLETTASPLFQHLRGGLTGQLDLSSLRDIRVTQGTSADGRIILLISPRDEDQSEYVEFVAVGDRWIPRSLADAWPTTLDAWRRRFAVKDPQWQQETLAGLTESEAGLDRLLAAETADQFRTEAVPLLLKLWQLYQRWQQPPGPLDGVSITIRGSLNDDQQTRLLLQLEQLSDDPERCVYSATSTGDAMIITLRPVKDVERFAGRLPFAADVEVDATGRTVSFAYRQP